MQRPKLEVASWIAGIIGTLIALAAFLYQFRQTQPTATAKAESLQPAESLPIAPASPSAPPSQSQVQYRTSLSAGLEAAKQLSNYKDREETILTIVRAAIRDDHYKFAFEASRSLNVYANRDAVATAVTCHLAHRGDYAGAREAALAINDYTVRDAALARISGLAAIKPGEGENGYMCRGP